MTGIPSLAPWAVPESRPGLVTPWQPASGHAKGWRVIRYRDGYGHCMEELCGATARRILVKTRAAAEAISERMNTAVGEVAAIAKADHAQN